MGTVLPDAPGATYPVVEALPAGVVVFAPIGVTGAVLLGYVGAGVGAGAGGGTGALQIDVSLVENETVPSPDPLPGYTMPFLLHAERLLLVPQLQHGA